MKLRTKVQYAEYRNNKHLRMETETVAHGNPRRKGQVNKTKRSPKRLFNNEMC